MKLSFNKRLFQRFWTVYGITVGACFFAVMFSFGVIPGIFMLWSFLIAIVPAFFSTQFEIKLTEDGE